MGGMNKKLMYELKLRKHTCSTGHSCENPTFEKYLAHRTILKKSIKKKKSINTLILLHTVVNFMQQNVLEFIWSERD